MSLPAAIQRQLEQADALQASMTAPETATPATPENDTAPVTEASTPANAQASGDAPAAAPVPAASQPSSDDAKLWEQRYRTLQSKYDVEVPRLHTNLRSAMEKIAVLESAQHAATAEPAKKLVTQQDVDTFGGDLVDLIGRKAQEIAGEQVSALQATVKALEAKLSQTHQRVETSDDGRFFADLAGLVPDYKEVNADPRWLQWLTVTEPLAGRTRQQLLDEAAAARDVARVARLFGAFKESLVPAQAVQAAQQQQVAQELQRQVAPARSKGASAPVAPQATRVWTSRELNEHYRKVRMGELSPEQAARIESEINQAMTEGRIAP
jgi:hypothetical protein